MNKMRYLRIGVALAVLIVVFGCTLAHVPVGTLCALCPVGFAEIALASGSVPWGLALGVVALLAVVLLLGRAFCSWVCPTSLLRNIFGGRTPRGLTGQTGTRPGDAAKCRGESDDARAAGEDATATATQVAGVATGKNTVAAATQTVGEDATATTTQAASAKQAGNAAIGASSTRTRNNLASQGIVLAALLVISLIVHFPVFCLICPIGLVFGSMFAISRLLVTWQPGWELIVFPAMLLVEVFLLRRWCSAICPLGFFFGLLAKARTRLPLLPRLRVRSSGCLHSEGCTMCATVCPEDISISTADTRDLEDCTFCLDCKEHCPAHVVSSSNTTAR